MRCLSYRRVGRCFALFRREIYVAAKPANNCVDRLENCNVNNRLSSCGAAGAELLAKNAILAWRYRRVIETAGIDCDAVPTKKCCRGDGLWNRGRLGLDATPLALF